MAGKAINYYVDGNTAKGFCSLLMPNIEGAEHLFQICGAPGTGKSALITRLGNHWRDKGFDIEFLHSSLGYTSGVIIPGLGLGIIAPSGHEKLEPAISGKITRINLNAAVDPTKLSRHKGQITDLKDRIKQALGSAYEAYSEALVIHDEWEKIYISRMNFDEADAIAENLAKTIFENKKLNKKPAERRRFLGAATPEGPKDFVDNLTAGLPKRYFIKGRPGSGKSTLLKKLIAAALQRGFDTEAYHCGLDPDSLDMVIIRELGVSVFDSTPPHEYFPRRENDEIVDMYARVIEPGTDEKHQSELADIASRYRSKISKGTAFLAQAKKHRDDLKKIFGGAADIRYADKVYDDINSQIRGLI